jgi:hypothetical protein
MMHRINRDLGFFYLQKKERVVMINAVCEEEFVKKIHFVSSFPAMGHTKSTDEMDSL